MKRRKSLLVLIIMVALVVTGFTYAYWAGVIQVSNQAGQDENVSVAEGKDVLTNASFETASKTTGLLVPR